MEYCPGKLFGCPLVSSLGGDLREFLTLIGTLEEEEAQLYFGEMIMAVHTLHKMGYIHRFVKKIILCINQDIGI